MKPTCAVAGIKPSFLQCLAPGLLYRCVLCILHVLFLLMLHDKEINGLTLALKHKWTTECGQYHGGGCYALVWLEHGA